MEPSLGPAGCGVSDEPRVAEALCGSSDEVAARAPQEAGSDPDLPVTLQSFSDLSYRDLFWPPRLYEDMADRIALRAMLPRHGGRLIEIGAGYGRLADEYAGFQEVVLLDGSDTLLGAARERLGADPRFTFVRGDAHCLPFEDGTFDAAVCVRVIHHMHDPSPAVREMGRILRPGGVLVLESANKRNLKAIIAYALGRTTISPLSRGSEPDRGVNLLPAAFPRREDRHTPAASSQARWPSGIMFLHSPSDLRTWLRRAGFVVQSSRSVGLFRLPGVKTRVPLTALSCLERVQQVSLGSMTPGPSVFFRAVRRRPPSTSV